MIQFRIIAFFLLSLLAQLLHAEVSFSTRFTPEVIAKGQQTYYVITLTETSSEQPPEIERFETLPIGPNIGGLEFRRGGWGNQSQRQSGVNGRWFYQTSIDLQVEVVANGLGEFSVPAYHIEYKGNEYTIPSASLTVVERRNEPTADEQVFLSIDAPKEMFIGQSIDIYANLYLHERVSRVEYESAQLEGDGFSINETEATPTRSTTTVNGRRYQLLRWPMTVTAIQQGPEQQLSATAILSQVRILTQQRYPIKADPVFINVLPLPTEGQPTSFSGAIGDFQMQVSTDLDNTKTGEPIMLSLKLTGKGNFERIQGPALPDNNDWKVYAPESQIEGEGDNQAKRFDYVMIPKRTGTLKTPEVTFSFFDPEKSEYIEYTSPSLEVSVEQGRQHATTPILQESQAEQSDQELEQNLSRALTPEEALLTLDYRSTSARRVDAANPFASISFVLINLAGFITLASLSYRACINRRLREDPDYAMQQACTKELKTARRSAASAADCEEFYLHAQMAIRLVLSKRAKRNLRNAEQNQLLDYVASDSNKQTIATIFTCADALRFSDKSSNDDWKEQQAQLEPLLKAL